MAESPQVPVSVSAPPAAGAQEPTDDQVLVDQDLLVEEVSIDGMCGVY